MEEKVAPSKLKRLLLKTGTFLRVLNMYATGMPFYFLSRWSGLILIAIYGSILALVASTKTIIVLFNPEVVFKYKDTVVSITSAILAISALLVAYCLTMTQITKDSRLRLHFMINSSRFMLGTMKLLIVLAVILLTTIIAKSGNFPVLLKNKPFSYIFYSASFLSTGINLTEGFFFILRGFVSIYKRVSFDLLLMEGEGVDEAHKKYIE